MYNGSVVYIKELCGFCSEHIMAIFLEWHIQYGQVHFNNFLSPRDEFSVDAAQLQICYFKKLMKLSSEHRYAHEYGVLSATKGEEPEQQTHHLNQEAINIIEKNNVFIAGAKENKQDLLHMPERRMTSGYTRPLSVNSFVTVRKNKEYKQKRSNQYSFNRSEESKDNNVLISPKRNKISKPMMASNGGNCLQRFDSSQK